MNQLEIDAARDNSQKLSHEIVKKLSASQIYKDYEKAFSETSGLQLEFNPIESLRQTTKRNPFCALLEGTNNSCPECLALQMELEQKAQIAPVSLRCFAGICNTAVPIRMEDRVIAFLKTRQVLLHQTKKEEFSKIARQLLDWGVNVDFNSLEHAYFQSKVLDQNSYKGFVQLLSIFAEHLGVISNSILIQKSSSSSEPEVITEVKRYVSNHYDGFLTLEQAASIVNMSIRHFCRVFKQFSGITFIEYLSRLRIEKAKNLLLNPQKHISEIAFEVGFESLSQFNRSFKHITGKTPTAYRQDVNNL